MCNGFFESDYRGSSNDKKLLIADGKNESYFQMTFSAT